MSQESTNGNGSQVGKTIKELVLEHDEKLDAITVELSKAKGALYLAVLLGLVNVLDTLIKVVPQVARGAQ